jgi:histidine triad (HIT) family protein
MPTRQPHNSVVIRPNGLIGISVRFLYKLAGSWLGGILLGWIFSYLSFAIPADRLHETESIFAFHHPDPSYSAHILLVPKRKYRTLLDIPADDIEFMRDLFRAVQDLVNELGLEDGGYRLVVNGGDAQDIQHLHFHLISDVSLNK